MQPVQGIHHITAMASDPQANVDFYHHVLGQRLIKTTVNFDDPGTYHLYYADEIGSPGTNLTFFPWPGARRGRRGSGETGAVAYSIRPESLEFWREHLTRQGIAVRDLPPRFGEPVLAFEDPDGMPLELIATPNVPEVRPWLAGPIPAEHILRGFHSVTLWVPAAKRTAAVLTGPMGYTFVGDENTPEGPRQRYRGAGDVAPVVDLLIMPTLARGTMGAGTVHHVAFRANDDAAQDAYRDELIATGLGVTPRRDRQYFHSIYFREPAGVLFEIATDGPGFLIDETLETLGTALKLPPWVEQYRSTIEAALPPLRLTRDEKATGHA